MNQTKILSTGSYFPEKIITNEDLAKLVDTNDAWITERTGIKTRHVISREKHETNTDMGRAAAEMALKRAGKQASDIDFIIYATVTGDHIVPNASCLLQDKLGATNAAGMDLSAACSGFLYGLSVANAFIQIGQYKTILLVGADVLSEVTDWTDRSTCILFGDAAGAVLLGATSEADKSRVYSSHLYMDGRFKDIFYLPAGGTAMPASHETVDKKLHYMQMKGREIFKVAVRMLADCAVEALTKNGLTSSDLNWFIPHQANSRIIEAVAKRLGLSLDKVIMNIDRYGNTSSATVPTAFDEAVTNGKIKRGDLVLMDVFGAGLTWGSVLLRY